MTENYDQYNQRTTGNYDKPKQGTTENYDQYTQWATEGYNPDDPHNYLGDDIISRIIIDLEAQLGTQLCMNFTSDFPLGYQCGDFCMSAEWICDSVYDCSYYFNDESEAACQARRDIESIFEICEAINEDCYGYNMSRSLNKKEEEMSKSSMKENGKLRPYDDVHSRIDQQAKRANKRDLTGILFKMKENLPKERHYMKTPKQSEKMREMKRKKRSADNGKK
ncbi:uncharacterized protein [Ptychodera flava]|uniref:uncharacterized protein n=1 Tax=Ptychodera flava TaxID=63121 RepID=UPI003969E59B